jgi:signal transduction histidine kinase
MRELVTETLAGMSQVFKEKGIEVEARLPERVPPVQADLDRVIQVLLNLLSNAVKFCAPERGRIEVSVAENPGSVRVDVRDNGPGISDADQRIIFDKFRQAGDTLTEKPSGTGLGLHISRQIVEHFGGRMWVESRLGAGACFSFTLPVEPARAEACVT